LQKGADERPAETMRPSPCRRSVSVLGTNALLFRFNGNDQHDHQHHDGSEYGPETAGAADKEHPVIVPELHCLTPFRRPDRGIAKVRFRRGRSIPHRPDRWPSSLRTVRDLRKCSNGPSDALQAPTIRRSVGAQPWRRLKTKERRKVRKGIQTGATPVLSQDTTMGDARGVNGADVSPSPLGICLRQLRRAAGMKQATLAKRSGRSQTLIALLESGKRTSCRRSTLERLAAALGVSADRLIVEIGQTTM
jgi:DNA-binding XRE family transcriptional regulator